MLSFEGRERSRLMWLSSPWLYFGLTYLWSWLFWIPAALARRNVFDFPLVILLALGGLGPFVAAMALNFLRFKPGEWRDYWRRVVDLGRISAAWYGVIFLLSPTLSLLALMTHLALGNDLPAFETATDLLSRPGSLITFALFVLVYGPIPEELGWRGYVLDRLQERWSAVTASVILGIMWGWWHLPLFFMEGTYQQAIRFGTLGFWVNFNVSIVALTVLITWVYNNTDRSILSAILIHFMVNFTGSFLEFPEQVELYKAVWTVIAAMVVILRWGPELTQKERGFPSLLGKQG